MLEAVRVEFVATQMLDMLDVCSMQYAAHKTNQSLSLRIKAQTDPKNTWTGESAGQYYRVSWRFCLVDVTCTGMCDMTSNLKHKLL